MPRPKSDVGRKRFNLELPETVMEKLIELKKMSESDTLTEAIRRSINLHHSLLRLTESGKGRIIIQVGSEEKELILS